MKKSKKLVFSMMAGTMVLSSNVFAADLTVIKEVPTQVESIHSSDIELYATYKPSEKDIHNLNNGKMTFYGTANSVDLYTNNHFTGKSSVSYEIANKSDKKLVAKVYKKGSLFAEKTITVSPNATQYGTISGLSSSELYYIRFIAPCNFSGHVK